MTHLKVFSSLLPLLLLTLFAAPAVPAVHAQSVACPVITLSLYYGRTDAQTGGQVTALQRYLAADPSLYPEGLVTGFYGSLTTAAVQRFQVRNGVVSGGIPATTGYGVVGPKTRSAIAAACYGSAPSATPPSTSPPSSTSAPASIAACPGLTRTLSLGSTDATMGGEVTILQKYLAADPLLYPEGLVTGYYGSLTVAAVQRFQERNGISGEVGVVGAQTRAAIATQCFGVQAPTSMGSGLLRVLSPNGGEVYRRGSTAEITWSGQSSSPNIDIYIKTWFRSCIGDIMCGAVNALAKTFTIARNVSNNGQYNWVVDRDVNGNRVENGYFTLIISNTEKTVVDMSDDFFAIASSTEEQDLKYLATSPGQELKKGSIAGLVWASSFSVTHVNVYLKQGGASYELAKNTPNENVLVWSVGKDVNGSDIPPGAYSVVIEDVKTGLTGTSSSTISFN